MQAVLSRAGSYGGLCVLLKIGILKFRMLTEEIGRSVARLHFFLRFYLFIHEREREAETQAEGEAGSMQGAQCRTRSQDPGVTPWAEGRRSTTEPPRGPIQFPLILNGD